MWLGMSLHDFDVVIWLHYCAYKFHTQPIQNTLYFGNVKRLAIIRRIIGKENKKFLENFYKTT